MAKANQYFQLVEQAGRARVKIIPAQEEGQLLDIKEVLDYLDQSGYSKIDIRDLNHALQQNLAEEIDAGEWQGFHEQEKMKLSISSDNMLAYARFYAPSNQGQLMDYQEILNDLKAYGVTVGIQEATIRDFLKTREYCKTILVAKGIPPVQGKDAKIEYLFNTNPNLKPKRNEDGTVDYHQLNTINHVTKGQCLARMEKEVPGEPGKNVFGEVVQPKQVNTKKFSFSNNIELSEDGMELRSMVNGHASYIKGKVFVSDVFEVPADVDNTTGNIDYDGNVTVKGNVKSGFRITAKGDIVVEGVVEGAQLYAGGQIIVKRGIHGMTKGILKAEGNIITKFIESAEVISSGYIDTESILHSTVSASTEVRVRGRKGFITGGVIRAGNIVEANNIGSEMGAATRIEVGVDPEEKERYNKLQKEIAQINKEVEQIRPILKNFSEKAGKLEQIPPEKQQQVQMLAKTFKEHQQRLPELNKEMEVLHERMAMATNAKIRIRGTIYPGVKISISDMEFNIKKNYNYSQIYKDKGEIVIRPL